MNVLVIAPHPDDEAIGCGGAVCKHADAGERVVAVFLTSGELGLKHLPRDEAWRVREGEARRAAEILGIAELHFFRGPDWTSGGDVKRMAMQLDIILKQELPDLMYVPHPAEWHPDHKAALPVVRSAVHRSGIKHPMLRGYEIWSPMPTHDHIEDISTVMQRKLEAVRAHRSQMAEFNYERAVRGLNEYRGALGARCQYAEVFQALHAERR